MSEANEWEWAHASRPHPGESDCGDEVWSFVDAEAGELLLAVIDGLGHGAKARQAALACRESFEQSAQAGSREPTQLLRTAHEAIRSSRGVAASLLRLTRTEIVFAGIGNVACATTHEAFRPFPRDGILGYRFRAIHPHAAPRQPMWLALFTDGLPALNLERFLHEPVSQIPEKMLQTATPSTDDQAVAVVRIV